MRNQLRAIYAYLSNSSNYPTNFDSCDFAKASKDACSFTREQDAKWKARFEPAPPMRAEDFGGLIQSALV